MRISDWSSDVCSSDLRVQRAPCELAMADVAAAGRPETTDFADRIGREVIVQHEVRIGQAVEAVDHLLAVLGAQGAGRDGLRLAAREQRRAVGAGQDRKSTRLNSSQ